MKGNFHVRFLGEEAAVMPVSLPDPKKTGRIMRLHGLLVCAWLIGFLAAIIPSPSHAQSLA
jgi:hypothetical protein